MIYLIKGSELFGKFNSFVNGSSKPLILLFVVLLLMSGLSPMLSATEEDPGLKSNDYDREPMEEALEAMESDENVTVTEEQDDFDSITFDPVDEDPEVGLAFSAGADVDPRAYAPAARSIAEEGYFVVLFYSGVGMPDGSPFGDVTGNYPEIEEWSVGGHSNGGVDACDYFDNKEPEGLTLWASYPSPGFLGIGEDDLRDKEGEFVSIYGTNDGLTTVDDIEDSKSRLPGDTEFVKIEGGNHAQFGWYGEQEDDNEADISREEQQDIIIDATIDHLNAIKGMQEHELSIDSQAGGTTDPEPGTYTHAEGEEVTVEALPDEGYEFVEWTGDHNGTDSTITVPMDEEKSITAVFDEQPQKEYNLTINVDGEGSTNPTEGTYTYAEGEEVTVTAIPDDGYYFDNWTGDHKGTNEEITITMNEDKSITAHFYLDKTAPTASFSYSPTDVSVGDPIQFTDESTDEDGSISSWSWDFGDGEISTEQNPTHVYDEAGNYTVELTVTDYNDLSDTTTAQIEVQEEDYQYFTATNGEHENNGRAYSEFNWFDDDDYYAEGSDDYLGSESDETTLRKVEEGHYELVERPEANFTFTPENPDVDETVDFDDGSIEGDETIVEWSWDFGDGETSAEQNPTYTYEEEGDYTVELTVTDANGLSDTVASDIFVGEMPTFTAKNSEHKSNGRAYSEGWWNPDYYAEGSGDYLGSESDVTTLRKVEEGHYEIVEEEGNAEDDGEHSSHSTILGFGRIVDESPDSEELNSPTSARDLIKKTDQAPNDKHTQTERHTIKMKETFLF